MSWAGMTSARSRQRSRTIYMQHRAGVTLAALARRYGISAQRASRLYRRERGRQLGELRRAELRLGALVRHLNAQD